jgi:SAM-dependent methyltransferase
MIQFTCNICGKGNRAPRDEFEREEASCAWCGSSVRMRGLLRALSLEIFGVNLTLPEFPRVKSLRGLGMSDSEQYADQLALKFDYRNTSYDREPRIDLRDPPALELGTYDFILSSEVFEHVLPPSATAFDNAFRLLKPAGVLVLTVPYSIGGDTKEHFGKLGEFGLAQVGDRVLLVNRTASGEIAVHDNLVFHFGANGPALEMREFSEIDLKTELTRAGFGEVCIYTGNYAPFGAVTSESWSLPIAARKGTFTFSRDATRDVLEQWATLQKNCREWAGSLWVRLGSKLGWVDLTPLIGGARKPDQSSGRQIASH